MIIAFTGHRPDALGGYSADNPVKVRVKAAIRTAMTQLRSAHGDDLRGISGMALGVDQWAAEVCIELKVPFTKPRQTSYSIDLVVRGCSSVGQSFRLLPGKSCVRIAPAPPRVLVPERNAVVMEW